MKSSLGQSVTRAAIELGVLIGCLFVLMWVLPMMRVPDQVGYGIAGLMFAFFVVCYVRDGVSARELGIRFDNFWRVLGRLLVPIGVGVVLLILVGWEMGSLRPWKKIVKSLIGVPVWGFVQHYMLLAFANRRLRVLCRRNRASVIATAVLFGMFHMPNFMLMFACAIGGYIWADLYERDPNLFASACTHGLASAFLSNTLPRTILKNMVVGFPHLMR